MDNIADKIINGYDLSEEDVLKIYNNLDSNILFEEANKVRTFFMNDEFDLCSIINAKSGKCSEDCKYCAQSSYYNTGVEEYELINAEKAIKRAKENSIHGINHFSLVTSGKGLNGKDFDKILDIFSKIRFYVPKISLCASLGIISFEQAVKLKEVGVNTYHHNIETSKRFYPSICTTHTYDDRINTIENVKKAGLKVCSGGIIGMGESIKDRIDMAFALKKLNIKSIPINILNPVKGTPYDNLIALDKEEILRIFSIFRLVLPNAFIRYAGGRMRLGSMHKLGYKAGVNAALVGNYLTTIGNNIENDIQIIKKVGYNIKSN